MIGNEARSALSSIRPQGFKSWILWLGVLLLLFLSLRSYAPDAGHEIVLIKKPLFFGHGGVDGMPVKTGRTYAAVTTNGIDVYMQPQKRDVELPDTMTSDGVPITFHTIMIVQVTDSVLLIRNFGPQWYENNLEEQFKTMVRQAVRKRGMNETAISTTALDQIDAEIRDTGTAHQHRAADEARGGPAHGGRDLTR